MATPYTDTVTESKGGAKTDTSTSRSNAKPMDTNGNKSGMDTSPRGVGFSIVKDSHSEKKKKYLTAKYGQHQMLLIKKRLKVEMWVFDELRKLYESEGDDHDCDLDVEDLLNCDTDSERRQYAERQLADAKQSRDHVNKFIEELLKQ